MKSEEHCEWNTLGILNEILEFLDSVLSKDIDIVLIPDFSNPYFEFSDFSNLHVCSEAALDVRFRYSLYSHSLLNISGTNGPAVYLLACKSPSIYIAIDPELSKVTGDLDIYNLTPYKICIPLNSFREDRELHIHHFKKLFIEKSERS